MNRRTIYTDENIKLEDPLLQTLYVMKAISSLAAGLVGSDVNRAGGIRGTWLPGPYGRASDYGPTIRTFGEIRFDLAIVTSF